MCVSKSVYLYNSPYSLKVYKFAYAHFSIIVNLNSLSNQFQSLQKCQKSDYESVYHGKNGKISW